MCPSTRNQRVSDGTSFFFSFPLAVWGLPPVCGSRHIAIAYCCDAPCASVFVVHPFSSPFDYRQVPVIRINTHLLEHKSEAWVGRNKTPILSSPPLRRRVTSDSKKPRGVRELQKHVKCALPFERQCDAGVNSSKQSAADCCSVPETRLHRSCDDC